MFPSRLSQIVYLVLCFDLIFKKRVNFVQELTYKTVMEIALLSIIT